MNDSVSILVAVFFILIALRWMLGGNQPHQQGQRRTTVRRPQHQATPQMIQAVSTMFPDIPTEAIQADLQRTGSVETTVDNALRDGGLPLPPPVVSSSNNHNNSDASGSNSRKSPSHPNLIQRYKIDVEQQDQQNEEPAKIWESSPDKRQETLRKRKEFMVLQARQKLMEQQKKKAAEVAARQQIPSLTTPSTSTFHNERIEVKNIEQNGSKGFEEMSVEELNSLSPEQRRIQMLQAYQNRAD